MIFLKYKYTIHTYIALRSQSPTNTLYRVFQLALSETKHKKDHFIDTFRLQKNGIGIFLRCGQLFICSFNLRHITQVGVLCF